MGDSAASSAGTEAAWGAAIKAALKEAGGSMEVKDLRKAVIKALPEDASSGIDKAEKKAAFAAALVAAPKVTVDGTTVTYKKK